MRLLNSTGHFVERLQCSLYPCLPSVPRDVFSKQLSVTSGAGNDVSRSFMNGGAALQAQSLVHTSVFSPPPALHPYQDLALGWQQSSKLLDHCQGVSTELVQAWDQQSVASFITSVTGSQRCGAVFQERVRIAALTPSACRHRCQVLQSIRLEDAPVRRRSCIIKHDK